MMKRSILLALVLAVFMPRAAKAQTIRVQAFALHPPKNVRLEAVDGELRWRLCETCAERSGQVLTIEVSGGEISAGTERGAQLLLTGHYRLASDSAPTVTSSNPVSMRPRDGRLLIVFTMPLEDYVGAVLSAEAGDLKSEASRKAMAVVVRTYASHFHPHAAEGFDVCDDTHCQLAQWGAIDPRSATAVAATKGEVVMFAGSRAATYYHQNCGGTLAAAKEVWPDAGQPYLVSHPDPYCVLPTGPFRWESTVSISDVTMALHASGLQTPREWSGIEIVRRSGSGRALTLRMGGGASAPVLVSASSFRYSVGRALGWNKIRSDLYDIRAGNGAVTFSGRGSGHGVGLCQAGAEQMGLQGKSYREILAFYFPGTQISHPSGPEWQQRFSDRFELDSVSPDQDSFILPIAARILEDDERVAGWRVHSRVRLQAFPTLDAYRDTTGQPGWVAASTRGSTIRLQPLKQLQNKSVLQSTLRHELFHVLVESQAASGIPLWFREGLVLYLSGEISPAQASASLKDAEVEAILQHPRSRDDMERAHTAAYARVSDLVAREGRATVIGWLSHGLPANIGSGL